MVCDLTTITGMQDMAALMAAVHSLLRRELKIIIKTNFIVHYSFFIWMCATTPFIIMPSDYLRNLNVVELIQTFCNLIQRISTFDGVTVLSFKPLFLLT